MSDITDMTAGLAIEKHLRDTPRSHHVDEAYWGYIITKGTGPALRTVVLQSISLFLGACFAAAGLGLLLVPQAMSASTDILMRGGAAVFFGALAAYLLWFASRGAQSEIQIDTALQEVREVVRNRDGKSTLIGRYAFDSIGGVFLDRTGQRTGHAVLMLRYRNTAQTLPVATGREIELTWLKDRLGQDLMLLPNPHAHLIGRRPASAQA